MYVYQLYSELWLQQHYLRTLTVPILCDDPGAWYSESAANRPTNLQDVLREARLTLYMLGSVAVSLGTWRLDDPVLSVLGSIA